MRTIPLSISGILVGSASAFLKDDFNISVFTLAIFTTICYQLLSNFANDYGDGVKGTDNDERLGHTAYIYHVDQFHIMSENLPDNTSYIRGN